MYRTNPLFPGSVVYSKVIPFLYIQMRHHQIDQLLCLGLPLRNSVGRVRGSKASCMLYRGLHGPTRSHLNVTAEDLPVEQLHNATNFVFAQFMISFSGWRRRALAATTLTVLALLCGHDATIDPSLAKSRYVEVRGYQDMIQSLPTASLAVGEGPIKSRDWLTDGSHFGKWRLRVEKVCHVEANDPDRF